MDYGVGQKWIRQTLKVLFFNRNTFNLFLFDRHQSAWGTVSMITGFFSPYVGNVNPLRINLTLISCLNKF